MILGQCVYVPQESPEVSGRQVEGVVWCEPYFIFLKKFLSWQEHLNRSKQVQLVHCDGFIHFSPSLFSNRVVNPFGSSWVTSPCFSSLTGLICAFSSSALVKCSLMLFCACWHASPVQPPPRFPFSPSELRQTLSSSGARPQVCEKTLVSSWSWLQPTRRSCALKRHKWQVLPWYNPHEGLTIPEALVSVWKPEEGLRGLLCPLVASEPWVYLELANLSF